jgi:hypothetical protein
LLVLTAKKLIVRPGTNVDRNTPPINRISIVVTPSVKSFVGDGKDICVCSVVFIPSASSTVGNKCSFSRAYELPYYTLLTKNSQPLAPRITVPEIVGEFLGIGHIAQLFRLLFANRRPSVRS